MFGEQRAGLHLSFVGIMVSVLLACRTRDAARENAANTHANVPQAGERVPSPQNATSVPAPTSEAEAPRSPAAVGPVAPARLPPVSSSDALDAGRNGAPSALAGGPTCPDKPCAAGSICLSAGAGNQVAPLRCVPNPCAPGPLSCACAGKLCPSAGACAISGGMVRCMGRCAAADTPIATPRGERAIASLGVGDLVYSLHRGRLIAVPVARTSRVLAPHHTMLELLLDNGRRIRMSPAHPGPDGTDIAALPELASLGETRIVARRAQPYEYQYTYDILPASDSRTYLAAGALVGSTLVSAD